MFWIIILVVVVLVIGILYADHKKKTKPKNELFEFATTMTSSVFPNGKEDHMEGAQIICETINRKMPLDECKDLFIKAAIFSNISDDLQGHLSRRYGKRLTDEDIKHIIGFLTLRKMMLATGSPVRFVRNPENGSIACFPREKSTFKE